MYRQFLTLVCPWKLYHRQLPKTHTQVYLAEHASGLRQGPLNPNRSSPDAGRLLPAALRRLGVLRLSADLAAAVDLGKPLEGGDPLSPPRRHCLVWQSAL